ncbi:MAG: hypothetical protein KME55_36690 [Nostoc indistinguendum CM1-VF10]|nr:hypothetical protein [Nostoc indistinguendum CM1-VF10]
MSIIVNPSKIRRYKGEGRGSIHWRMITKKDKDYPQVYYHYRFWSEGDRLVKLSKYIPKHLLNRVQEIKQEKTPVREILKVWQKQ